MEVGYGPVCAKHYGLPHHPKGSRKMVPLPVVVPQVPALDGMAPLGMAH